MRSRPPRPNSRHELRWLLVHEAGCVDCRRCHDDELISDLVLAALKLGAGIPRSFRRLIPPPPAAWGFEYHDMLPERVHPAPEPGPNSRVGLRMPRLHGVCTNDKTPEP
jgi:hypothetical protein